MTENKGDLISREALKKDLRQYFTDGVLDGVSAKLVFNQILHDIDNAPTVAVNCKDCDGYEAGYSAGLKDAERPQGEWIKEDDEHLKGWYRCSECGRRVEDLTDDVVIHAGCEDYTIADIYPYCHCGAKMTGGGKE